MIYKNDNIAFDILDVFEIFDENVKSHVSGRNFHAISFRRDADTFIEYNKDTLHLSGGSVTYFPNNISYFRNAKKDNLIVIHFELFNYVSDKIQTVKVKNSEAYQALFEKILKTWRNKERGCRFECMEYFASVFKMLQIETEPKTEVPFQISETVSYMLCNYTDSSLTVEGMAKMSYISEVYFRRLFKSCYGITPKQYLTQLRMEYANSLLNSKYFTIRDVAEMSGFSNQRYFTAAYKKIYGVPPSEYKYNQ